MDVLGASEPFTATWFDALTTLEFKRAVLPSWSYSSAYGIVWLDEASLSPTDSGADTVIHGRDEFPPERQLRELHEHSLAHRAAGRDISALSFFLGGKTKFWTLEKLDAVRSYACLKDRIERGRHFLDLLHLHHAIGAIEEDEVQYIHHQPLFICRGGDFSLSYGDLGVLAGEKWLSNQVIDFHIFSVLQFSAPGTVILDAGFSTVLRGAYDNQITESTATAKRPYGHVLTSAASQGIRLVGFAHYTPSHWESVLLDLPASTISYGCSLGYSMPTDLQSALEWWLGGASLQQGSLLDAPYQGATSGSCGVVAVNTLLRGVQLAQGLEPCDPWTQETAAAHRSMWFLGALKVLSNLPMHTPAAASDIVMAKTPPVPAWRPSEPTAAPSSPNSSTGALQRLFMSSPVMIDALGQFGDVLIADVAQGRNVYNMPLNVFSVIDGCGKTRNIGYAVQDREDHASHAWVLHALLRTTGKKPSVIISDQDAAFISAVREVLPTSHHVLCLYHLWQNIVKQLKGKLRGQWVSFAQSFWRVYKAPSPNAFEARWRDLLESYPRARTYLETYQYKNRRSWAAAWVRTRFTADTRTTGRVESENGLSKLLSDRKSTLSDLFSRLLLRAEDQMAKSIKVSAYLHKKPTPTEVLFQVVIDTCRDQCHVWAVRRIVGEMEEGVMYSAVAVSMPPVPVSVPNIPASAPNQTSAFASGPGHPQQHDEHMDDEEENVGDEVNGKEEEEEEVGYNPTQDLEDDLLAEAHENGEEGTIEEENTTTGIPVDIDGVELDGGYLVELVTSSGHEVVRAYRVTHFKATNPRIVLVTKDGLQFCTCSESTASGVPCRHSWATIARGEWFHMADVNARWLRKGHSPMDPVQVNTSQFEIPEPVLAHNGSCRTGLDTAADALSPAPDATLPHAQVYHQALTIMRPVMNSITTPAGLRQFEQMVDEFM
ncbi:unnamed protein product [Tilletia controversa]|nr:unnamed protein product [Tilletia controversa]